MGYTDGPYWWAILMDHADGPYWWAILMGQPDGPYWWAILMGHTDGPYWWAIPMGHADGQYWRAILMGSIDWHYWSAILMGSIDGLNWWAIGQPKYIVIIVEISTHIPSILKPIDISNMNCNSYFELLEHKFKEKTLDQENLINFKGSAQNISPKGGSENTDSDSMDGTKLFHSSSLTNNHKYYLGTKLFHSAFLIQNGPP